MRHQDQQKIIDLFQRSGAKTKSDFVRARLLGEEFMANGTLPILGSKMVVNLDPVALAENIVADMKVKREKLGWRIKIKRS